MGIIDRIKEFFIKDKNVYESEQVKQDYKMHKTNNQSDIQRFERDKNKAKERMDEIRKTIKDTYPNLNSTEIDKILLSDKMYLSAQENYNRWSYAMDMAKKESEFIRPNTANDIAYRTGINIWDNEIAANYNPEKDNLYAYGNIGAFMKKWEHMEFNEEVKKLRFHATPIHTAKAIIESGGIISTADRFDGYHSSTDIEGEISSSPYDELTYSMNFFMGMRDYRIGLPCGCVFAVYPKEDEEIVGYCMKNIDFSKNPEQLYAIFTTPENVENVSKWAEDANLNVNVCTFEGFLECLQKDFEQKIPSDAEVVSAIRKEEHIKNGPRIEISKEEQNEELETSSIEEEVLNGNIEDVKKIVGDNENTMDDLVKDDQTQDL